MNTQLEEKNFHVIHPGSEFATINSTKEKLVIVSSESHEDISDEYLERTENKILFKKPVTLSMFTRNERAIRQDCACYFMEELHIG